MSETRRRVKIKWKNVAIAALAVLLLFYLLGLLIGKIYRSVTQDSGAFTACNLSASKLRKTITSEEYESTAEIQDYVIYGEYLSLYGSPYGGPGSQSTLAGKAIVLRNVCTGEEIRIDKASNRLDGQINLGELPQGFYEVYMVENLLNKRLYFTEPLTGSTSITTVTRNGSRNVVTLYGEASLLNQKNATENVLDNNYAFIDVRKADNEVMDYDIVLNPGPVVATEYYDLEANGLKSSEEMYRFAVALSQKLTEKGYRVLLTRDDLSWAGMYGDKGIASIAYNAKAKYFFSFDMYSGTPITGLGVYCSNYVSDSLANHLFDALIHQGGMSGQNGTGSVYYSNQEDGYDVDIDIREVGGKALGAGQREDSKENEFASNLNGVYSIYFELCNIAIEEDAKFWTEHFDQIVDALAEGIDTYINPSETQG